MGYRRHTARENVLEDPGARDITAHVNFTALEEYGAARGSRAAIASRRSRRRCSPPASRTSSPPRMAAGRMQLKTLLFGMGKTFRVFCKRR